MVYHSCGARIVWLSSIETRFVAYFRKMNYCEDIIVIINNHGVADPMICYDSLVHVIGVPRTLASEKSTCRFVNFLAVRSN